MGMPLVPANRKSFELICSTTTRTNRLYINSTGTSGYNGDPVGFETEAFAICDTMRYIKPPIHTICLGSAMGMAAMLSAGTKGCSLPNAHNYSEPT